MANDPALSFLTHTVRAAKGLMSGKKYLVQSVPHKMQLDDMMDVEIPGLDMFHEPVKAMLPECTLPPCAQRPRRQSEPGSLSYRPYFMAKHNVFRPRAQTIGKKRVRFKRASVQDVVLVANLLSYEDLLCIVAGFCLDEMDLYLPSRTLPRRSIDYIVPAGHSPVISLAAFFYRSARYLGICPKSDIWQDELPDAMRFTNSDMNRWRRLAHYNWEEEDQIYRIGPMFLDPTYASPFRSKVSKWFNRKKDPLAMISSSTSVAKVSHEKDLKTLTLIVNSSITIGCFQFTANDIHRLCRAQVRSEMY